MSLDDLKSLRSAALEIREKIIFNIQAGRYNPQVERGMEQMVKVITEQTDRMEAVLASKGVVCG
jgi:hypothetical protein